MRTPLEEVVYAMPALPALTYYFMQFVIKDYAWEKYPKYIQGTVKSRKVCGVFYYDKLEDYIIRSSPYTREEKWRFHKKYKKSVLPERKKHLVLKKGSDYNGNTSTENDRSNRTVIDIGKFGRDTKKVARYKKQVPVLREELHGERKTKLQRVSTSDNSGKSEIEVVAECCRRPIQRRTIRRLSV